MYLFKIIHKESICTTIYDISNKMQSTVLDTNSILLEGGIATFANTSTLLSICRKAFCLSIIQKVLNQFSYEEFYLEQKLAVKIASLHNYVISQN